MEQTPQTKGSGKSTGAIIVAVLIIVVVVILWAVNSPSNGTTQTNSQNSGQPTFNGQLSQTDQAKELTKSVEVTAGPLGSEKKPVKTYEVKMENGTYNPSELIVGKGGRVQVSMIAVDANYDIIFAAPLGVYLNVQKGQAAVFGFDATDDKVGEYIFTCKDVCPASGGMQGKLIIK